MSDTEVKEVFKADDSPTNLHDPPPKEQVSYDERKMSDTDVKQFIGSADASESPREWSLDSDPSDIFQKVIEQTQKGSRRWSSAYDLPTELRAYETGQILDVLNQLLIVTREHKFQLQKIATLTQETKEVQQQLLTKVAEDHTQILDHFQRLESALKDKGDNQNENVKEPYTLKDLEKKLETPLVLQRKLDYIEHHVQKMTEEIKTLGIKFEEMNVSLGDERGVENQNTDKYLDEPSEKDKAGEVMDFQIAKTVTDQFEVMLDPVLKELAEQKESMNVTARNFEELKTYFQHDLVDGMPKKLAELFEDVKEALGKQITEAMNFSLQESITLTQNTDPNTSIDHTDQDTFIDLYERYLENNGRNDFCLDNEKHMPSRGTGRRQSCF